MLEKHYAPRARLLFFSGPPDAARTAVRAATDDALSHGQRVGLLLCHEDVPSFADLAETSAPGDAPGAPALLLEDLGPSANVELVGQRLFAAMRRLDALGVDTICARSLPTAGLGLAIDDRLTRAAGGHVIRVR